MKNKNLLALSLAVGMLFSTVPTYAANENHKVLGVIDFGKTTISEVAEALKGKCEPVTHQDLIYTTMLDDKNCFPEIYNFENLKDLILNKSEHNQKEKTISLLFAAHDSSKVIDAIKIVFSFPEEDYDLKQTEDVYKVIQETLNSTYDTKISDNQWKTSNYIVSCDLIKVGEPTIDYRDYKEFINLFNPIIEIRYRLNSQVAIEDCFKNQENSDKSLEVSKRIEQLNKLF